MKNILLLLLFSVLLFGEAISFTKKEQSWIDKKIPITYVYDIDWAPFEWKNEVNRHSGIIVDILNIISKKSNIKFEAIHTNSWSTAVSLAKNNKIDMYSAVPYSKKRAKYMNYTSNDIFQYNASLLQHIEDKTKYINLNDQLSTKTIAIVKSSSLGNYVREKYPQAKYIVVDKTKDGFDKLRNRTVDLFAINSATADYMINIKGLNNLKTATKLGYVFKLKIAISKNIPIEVINIIDKTISDIEKKEIDKIYDKWMKPIQTVTQTDWRLIIYLFVFVIIIIIFLIYRQTLLKEQQKILENKIKEKTKELQSLNNNLEDKVKEKTAEQQVLLSLFDKGDSVLFKWNNDENWSINYVSESIQSLLGYTKEDFINGDITYENCIHKDDLNKVQQEVLEGSCAYKDFFKHAPYRLLTKDGEIRWVLDYSLIVKNSDNIITHYIGYISNITEVKEKELLLVEQSKMASMGEMIGNIAHQWRQPLSIISTASTGMLMQKEFGILDDEKFIKSCKSINENAQYLSKTIDDFKNFIKGDRVKTIFNLVDKINNFLNLVEGSIKDSDITIIYSQKDIKIDGYDNELIQCLINIFNNAKDALNENSIEYKLIFISTSIEDKEVIIKIKDNAGGIPDKILPKIFEPYFTTKHNSQGTGLGLHMTYNLIVDGMNGMIEASNTTYIYEKEKFVGAEFTIKLPIT